MGETPDRDAGLCARCRWARVVRTPRSAFWLCMRSREDSRFPRYPRLPVRECPGHEPLESEEAVPEGPPPRDQG